MVSNTKSGKKFSEILVPVLVDERSPPGLDNSSELARWSDKAIFVCIFAGDSREKVLPPMIRDTATAAFSYPLSTGQPAAAMTLARLAKCSAF